MATKPYANQITVVDVRNYGSRISPDEPQLRMYAQVGGGGVTDIRFGHFSAGRGGDYNVAQTRKMSYLDDYVSRQKGRLAGVHSYLDLRYDELHVSLY